MQWGTIDFFINTFKLNKMENRELVHTDGEFFLWKDNEWLYPKGKTPHIITHARDDSLELNITPGSRVGGQENSVYFSDHSNGGCPITASDLAEYHTSIPRFDPLALQQSGTLIDSGPGYGELPSYFVEQNPDGTLIVIDLLDYSLAQDLLDFARANAGAATELTDNLERIAQLFLRGELIVSDRVQLINQPIVEAFQAHRHRLLGAADIVVDLAGPRVHCPESKRLKIHEQMLQTNGHDWFSQN